MRHALPALLLLASPAIAQSGLDTQLAACWSCHGEQGKPKDASIPIIWGQQSAYLEKQMRDFRSGDRDSQIMASMAESVRRDELPKASAFIAAKPWPPSDSKSATPPANIAACAGCHGDKLQGGDSPEGVAPRLAGQMVRYLEDQMEEFARGGRANAQTMTAIMKSLPREERAKLAAYLSGL